MTDLEERAHAAPSMRYGYVVPNNFGVADPAALADLAVHAEHLGFDSVWVNHHVLNVGYVKERLGEAAYHDALITLTWIASRTTRIQLGTSVLVMPYLHPMVLAKELATLDHLCQGRLMVGLGVGSLPEENAALGVPYKGRGRYSDEFLQVLKRLWADNPASFHGEFFDFSDITTAPKPQQRPHPLLLVGGNREVALRRVARFADGWHPLGLRPESVAKRLPTLRTLAAAEGRPEVPARVQVRLELSTVTPDRLAAYSAVGVTDLILGVSSERIDEQRHQMEQFAAAFIASAN